MTEPHVCGLQGYDPARGDKCLACALRKVQGRAMTDPTPEESSIRCKHHRVYWRCFQCDEIRAAVEAEREACAKVAQEYVYNTFASTEEEWRGAAAAIRARGENDD